MIQIEDVYAAINDGLGLVTVAYLVEKLTFRGIHVNNAAIRRLWLGQLELDEKSECRLIPLFPANENVIVVDTRGPAIKTKTSRQAMSDSEDNV